MHLRALQHLANSSRELLEEGQIIVFGSASLLASFPKLDEELDILARSQDADFVPTPYAEELARILDQALGKERHFHHKFGYYADIVRPIAFDNFPPGWRERLVPLADCEGVFCLEPHDMAAAKCLAGRPKDITLLSQLAADGRIDLDLVYERLWSMEMAEKWIVRSHAVLDTIRTEATKLQASRRHSSAE